MINFKLVETYADAIFGIAKEQNILEQMEEDLLYVEQIFKTQPEFCSFLESPLVEKSAKISLLQELFGDNKINVMAVQLLYVMVEKGRENYIEAAIQQFVLKSHEARGMVQAKVRVAKQMTSETQAKLKARLEEVSGKTVLLDIKEDPSIIGGVIIDIGDKRIDASVSRRLQDLERALMNNQVYNKTSLTTEIGGK